MSEEIRRQNEVVLQTLEMGDLVEFPGIIYSHWAVYIGMYHIFTNVLCSICIRHLINKYVFCVALFYI
jgi:hypothetical protein